VLTLFISVGCMRLKERSLFASCGDGQEALGEETEHVEEEAAHQSQPVVAREEVVPLAATRRGGSCMSGGGRAETRRGGGRALSRWGGGRRWSRRKPRVGPKRGKPQASSTTQEQPVSITNLKFQNLRGTNFSLISFGMPGFTYSWMDFLPFNHYFIARKFWHTSQKLCSATFCHRLFGKVWLAI